MDISTGRDIKHDARVSSPGKSPLIRTSAIFRNGLFSLCIIVLLALVFFFSPFTSQAANGPCCIKRCGAYTTDGMVELECAFREY